jgi:hypothetical protein
MTKRVKRNTSYKPPFGGRGQEQREYDAIHLRWVKRLAERLPEGVPNVEPITRCTACGHSVQGHTKQPHKIRDRYRDGRYVRCGQCNVAVKAHKHQSCRMPSTYVDDHLWPATFGDFDTGDPDTGSPIHRADEGVGYCFQCGGCQYYIPLEGDLGMDWGACSNRRSEYDGRVVFEHWTCRDFRH